MHDSFVSAVAEETAKVETEKRKAEMETNARVEGRAAQAKMRAALEEQLRGAEAAEKQRKEQEAAGAGRVVAVALMVRGSLTEAIKFAMKIQPQLDTAETLRARPDFGTRVQRFDYIRAKLSPLVQAGLAAKEQYTWCDKYGVQFRFEPARRRPDGVRWADGSRAAPAPAPAPTPAPARAPIPAWKGPQPDLYSTGDANSGSKWVRGATYAQAMGAGDVISAQVVARLVLAEKNIEQLMGERVEKERGSLAELKAATEQIQALQTEAKGHTAEIASLRKHLEIKNQEINKLQQEKQVWMSRSHRDCLMDTPPRHFAFSSPAALSTPEQVAHETPTKQLDMFGASAMASSPQGTGEQPQGAAGMPESATPAPATPAPSESEISATRSTEEAEPPGQRVERQASPEKVEAELSVAQVIAIRARWCSPWGEWPIHYKGPRPEAPKEQPQRQSKEEKAAMRAARQEGQRWESLAVALQGKRPQPPTPSPASKATLGQEGPSKAAAIEDDSSEANESDSEGDAGQ